MQITKGEDKVLTLYCHDVDGNAIDLTSLTAVTIKIPNASGSTISKTLGSGVTVATASEGKLSLTVSDSDDLLVAEDIPLEAILDFGTTRTICKFKDKLDVLAQLY